MYLLGIIQATGGQCRQHKNDYNWSRMFADRHRLNKRSVDSPERLQKGLVKITL